MKHKSNQKRSQNKKVPSSAKNLSNFKQINFNAAGIDIGSEEHWVSVPTDRDPVSVRKFACFTPDLHALADWLKQCKIETIAMESTGVYWIPLFQILETRGFEVKLVNAQHVKTVPGRKSDVLDCQWLHNHTPIDCCPAPSVQKMIFACYAVISANEIT